VLTEYAKPKEGESRRTAVTFMFNLNPVISSATHPHSSASSNKIKLSREGLNEGVPKSHCNLECPLVGSYSQHDEFIYATSIEYRCQEVAS